MRLRQKNLQLSFCFCATNLQGTTLIRSRPLHMLDNKRIDRFSCWHQFQPELFFQRLENRRARAAFICRRFLTRRPLQLKIESLIAQPGFVHDDAPRRTRQVLRQTLSRACTSGRHNRVFVALAGRAIHCGLRPHAGFFLIRRSFFHLQSALGNHQVVHRQLLHFAPHLELEALGKQRL